MNMRHLFVCGTLLMLVACAGNPPAWWNPQNRYGTVEDSTQPPVVQPLRVRKTPPITEQPTEPLADTSYEEKNLVVPVPEETESAFSENVVEINDQSLPLPSVLD